MLTLLTLVATLALASSPAEVKGRFVFMDGAREALINPKTWHCYRKAGAFEGLSEDEFVSLCSGKPAAAFESFPLAMGNRFAAPLAPGKHTLLLVPPAGMVGDPLTWVVDVKQDRNDLGEIEVPFYRTVVVSVEDETGGKVTSGAVWCGRFPPKDRYSFRHECALDPKAPACFFLAPGSDYELGVVGKTTTGDKTVQVPASEVDGQKVGDKDGYIKAKLVIASGS